MSVRLSVTASMAVMAVMMIAPSPASGLDLFDLTPGSDRSEVEHMLEEAGVRHRPRRSSQIEVRSALLEEVFDLQRAVLEFGKDGCLNTATVEVTPAPSSGGFEVLELYEEVKSILLRRLGSPVWERTTGDLRSSSEILVGLSMGGVERTIEWKTPHPIRAGIPRRVDGQILVVVVLSRHPFPPSDPFWGDHRR